MLDFEMRVTLAIDGALLHASAILELDHMQVGADQLKPLWASYLLFAGAGKRRGEELCTSVRW
jgi:hypothetical protein